MAERSASDREGAGSTPASGPILPGSEPEDGTRRRANPGYATFQIARALDTSEEHPDPVTRERARKKAADWGSVFMRMLDGELEVGSRTPVADVPAWATLEVLTGGFATGNLLAGGALAAHEKELLASLALAANADARLWLNAHFLTNDGLAELQRRLQAGTYAVDVPEEGALLVAAWLTANGHTQEARNLLDEIGPFFARLRFFPRFVSTPIRSSERVFLRSAGETRRQLEATQPDPQILAQRETIRIWNPLYDRFVAHFLLTVDGEPPIARRDPSGTWARDDRARHYIDGGWPCQVYPLGWNDAAHALLGEYQALRMRHRSARKPDDPRDSFRPLREAMARAARDPKALSGREVGRVRLILGRYVAKHGLPGSEHQVAARTTQSVQAAGPLHSDIAQVVASRLEHYPPDDGIDDIHPLVLPVADDEAAPDRIPQGATVPASIRRKLELSSTDTIDGLVERGLITSGDTLARLTPQVTSSIRAESIVDPQLRLLYAAIYRAFRRRRSVLLLNMESQVRIEELPWVAAIDRFRAQPLAEDDAARQALRALSITTLEAFPYAIVPNKLLQELCALASTAGLDMPLVDELAADIFMGRFSAKYLLAAETAGELLDGSLYARYYGIDYGALTARAQESGIVRRWITPREDDPFASLCARRAGVKLGSWDVVSNGMIIEQQQILTTQNLAVLFSRLSLREALDLPDLAWRSFAWIIRRQRMRIERRHAQLIMLKNTAYAWRQMIFYLSLSSDEAVDAFLTRASTHLAEQPPDHRARFAWVLEGLVDAVRGSNTPDRFLGWTKGLHPLLQDSRP